MMSRLIIPVLSVLCLSFVSCGDRCSTIPEDDEPRLTDLQFSAHICDNLDVDSLCRSLELFSQQQAIVKAFRAPGGDRLDSLIVELQDEDLSVINDLLDHWDGYESIYHPGDPAYWPSTSCYLVRYAENSPDTIIVRTLYQETIPETPESLREAILDIDALIRSCLE